MSRIGIIRDAIVRNGGSSNIVHYADVFPNKEQVYYKVERWSDGLDEQRRKLVVDELNSHPDIERAYLSKFGYYGYRSTGGHIKVIFPKRLKPKRTLKKK